MKKILIVEDDKHTRLLTSARLKPYYTVEEAENGEKALEILSVGTLSYGFFEVAHKLAILPLHHVDSRNHLLVKLHLKNIVLH